MNHSVLKQVILEQIEVIKDAEITDREYTFEKNVNYILVGLRRSGKSTLLYKIAKDLVEEGCDWSQIIFVNFEDDRLLGFSKEDFNDIIETAHQMKCYAMLEEGYRQALNGETRPAAEVFADIRKKI